MNTSIQRSSMTSSSGMQKSSSTSASYSVSKSSSSSSSSTQKFSSSGSSSSTSGRIVTSGGSALNELSTDLGRTSISNNMLDSSVNSGSIFPITMRKSFFEDPTFKGSWADLDQVMDNMIVENKKLKTKLDNSRPPAGVPTVRTPLGKSTAPAALVNDGGFAANNAFPKRWMFPRILSRSGDSIGKDGSNLIKEDLFPADFFKFKPDGTELDRETIKVRHGDDRMEITVDCNDFKPEDIAVNVVNGELVVSAKREEKIQEGNSTKFVSKSFTRRYGLPSDVEAQKVNCDLSSDGVLMVTVPRRAAVGIVELKN